MHINDKLAVSSLIKVLGLISNFPDGKFFYFTPSILHKYLQAD